MNRENAHLSPMKQKLSAPTISRALYLDKNHSAFLNSKVIKQNQIERLIKMMLEKYNNFYRERSASKEKTSENKENQQTQNNVIAP